MTIIRDVNGKTGNLAGLTEEMSASAEVKKSLNKLVE